RHHGTNPFQRPGARQNGGCDGQGQDPSHRPRRRRRTHAPGDQGADPRRRNQKGRRTGRRPGGGHHGRQEDQRPHPHVPPAAAHRRGHRLFLGGFHPPNRGHGALHRRDRRGDGGTHRRVGGGAHRI